MNSFRLAQISHDHAEQYSARDLAREVSAQRDDRRREQDACAKDLIESLAQTIVEESNGMDWRDHDEWLAFHDAIQREIQYVGCVLWEMRRGRSADEAPWAAKLAMKRVEDAAKEIGEGGAA